MAKNVMSFDKYIDNPSGKGSAVLPNRNLYKDVFKSTFDAILVREEGKVEYHIYKANDGEDSYYIYMKIPSEVVPKFYYDVVVRLYSVKNSDKLNGSVRQYAAQYFSNDPSFVFTYAYTFAKRDMFIKDLAPKMSRGALTQKPTVRNPGQNLGYVKSLYFAYLTMERYGLFSKPMLNQNAKVYNKKEVLALITHADEKIRSRQIEGEKVRKEKSANKAQNRERDNARKAMTTMSGTGDSNRNGGKAKYVKNVKKTSTIKKSKPSRTTKKT